MKKILIPALVLGSILAFKKVEKLVTLKDNVKAQLTGLKFKKLSSLNIDGIATISIVNPSNETVSFQNFVADINYKDAKLASIERFVNVDIKENSKTNIDIPFSVPILTIGVNAAALLKDVIAKNFSGIDIKGSIGFKNFSFPINQSNILKPAA